MLCRSANELYWMSRHIERAENTARLLTMSRRLALLPTKSASARFNPWQVPLFALGVNERFAEAGLEPHEESVLRYLIFGDSHPSSIKSCLLAARESARSQRGQISAEMYENLNATWLRMRQYSYEEMLEHFGLDSHIEWVKLRSNQFRGITVGTMIRDEAYQFIRLGTFVERTDNIIRMLDTEVLQQLPAAPEDRATLDFYYGSALLHALSAFEAYRKIYTGSVTPQNITELMILRADSPRSLRAATDEVYDIICTLCADSSPASRELERLAGALNSRLRFGTMDSLVGDDLQGFLNDFLSDLYGLTEAIDKQFLRPTYNMPAMSMQQAA